jgi:hypothetical protein
MAPSTEATLPSTMSHVTGNTTYTIVPLIVPAVSHPRYFFKESDFVFVVKNTQENAS